MQGVEEVGLASLSQVLVRVVVAAVSALMELVVQVAWVQQQVAVEEGAMLMQRVVVVVVVVVERPHHDGWEVGWQLASLLQRQKDDKNQHSNSCLQRWFP